MAGRGSRFSSEGAAVPKPLMSLWGRPFFWWAAESAKRAFDVAEMVFVVLGGGRPRLRDRAPHTQPLSGRAFRRLQRGDQRRGRDREARRRDARSCPATDCQRQRSRVHRQSWTRCCRRAPQRNGSRAADLRNPGIRPIRTPAWTRMASSTELSRNGSRAVTQSLAPIFSRALTLSSAHIAATQPIAPMTKCSSADSTII